MTGPNEHPVWVDELDRKLSEHFPDETDWGRIDTVLGLAHFEYKRPFRLPQLEWLHFT